MIVDWFGNNLFIDGKPSEDSGYFLESKRLVEEVGLKEEFRFFDTVTDIHDRFAGYDAICLPSVYEGCPNIICEAMAAGKPIVASDISDVRALIGSQQFLFDPLDPGDIANKLCEFSALSRKTVGEIGRQNRQKAESLFGLDDFARSYDELVHIVTGQSVDSK